MIYVAAHNHDGAHFSDGASKSSQCCGHQGAPPIPNQRGNSLAVGGVEGNQQVMIVRPQLAHGLMRD